MKDSREPAPVAKEETIIAGDYVRLPDGTLKTADSILIGKIVGEENIVYRCPPLVPNYSVEDHRRAWRKKEMSMDTKLAIQIARGVKQGKMYCSEDYRAALVALLEHGEKVEIPDFETAVRMVAVNMHTQGKFYIEIGVDPKTKEVGWSFEPTLMDEKEGKN